MDDATTFDARVYQTEVYRGSEVTTYKVRWKVGGRLWKEGFRTVAQADSFRSALLTAARKGEAFSLVTGRPVAWERAKAETNWYEFACAYVDMKWKQASAKYRKDIARALTAAHLPCWPTGVDGRTMRAFAGRSSGGDSTPSNVLTRRPRSPRFLPGSPATALRCRRWPSPRPQAECSNRQRAEWTAPKVSGQVDRRSVVNPRQARALLEAGAPRIQAGPGWSPSSR